MKNTTHVSTRFIAIAGILLVLSAIFALARGGGEEKADRRDSYRSLYYSRLVVDLSTSTALLKRLEQADYKTVTNVLINQIQHDLMTITQQTNSPWSEEQTKAISFAQDYLNKVGRK